MAISSRTLGQWFEEFEEEAFRLETLDDYSQSGGTDAYRAFLAGEPQPESYKAAAWVKTVRGAVNAGKRVYRVHVLATPLTPYLRFELGWGYHRNAQAGEEFFILDTTRKENPVPLAPDFWLFDGSVAGKMDYDEAGRYLGADFVEDERVAEFIRYRDVALSHAEPFDTWWAEHGA